MLNKYVFYEKDKIVLPDGSDYKTLLENKGYFLSSKNALLVNNNINSAKKLNLIVYNKNTNKYHKLDCKYALNSPVIEIIELSNLPDKAVPCKLCILNNVDKKLPNKTANTRIAVYPRDVYEKYSPVYRDSGIEFYVTDYTKYFYPSQKCLTTACMSLVKRNQQCKKYH